MTSQISSSKNNNSTKSNGVNVPVKRKSENLGLGDMIWVKIHGSSWWPAQVVDSKTLSKKVVPRKRSAVDVLVRLYGSYMYRYVDPVTCRLEFENILEKNDRNCSAIFENTLQKDLARLRTRSAKRNKSESNGEMQSESKKSDTNSVTTPNGKSPELSARRVKIMQNLGLIAPDGSPYQRKVKIALSDS